MPLRPPACPPAASAPLPSWPLEAERFCARAPQGRLQLPPGPPWGEEEEEEEEEEEGCLPSQTGPPSPGLAWPAGRMEGERGSLGGLAAEDLAITSYSDLARPVSPSRPRESLGPSPGATRAALGGLDPSLEWNSLGAPDAKSAAWVSNWLRILCAQITTLINHKDKPKRSDKTLKAIQQVGQAVNLAVGRFVTVGEAIANENQELKEEMNVACIEAKRAGETIAQLTDIAALDHPESDGRFTIFTDKTGVVKAARLLLSSVTKVLVLADRIVIKQIITSRNKFASSNAMKYQDETKLTKHEEAANGSSPWGHLENRSRKIVVKRVQGKRDCFDLKWFIAFDLKDEKKKARMAAARAVLEKCTMMLLTASKTCLRPPDCESARLNKGAVFHRMRLALEQVIEIVTDSRPSGEHEPGPVSISAGIREFKDKVEGLRDDLYLLSKESLRAMLRVVLEHTEDFTDSAYTSHENRERILELSQQAKLQLEQLLSAWMCAQSQKRRDATEDMEVALLKMCQCVNELHRELHGAATSVAADLLKYHSDHLVLKALKASGEEGNIEAVAEHSCKLSEQKEQLLELCRLLRHVSGMEPLEITCLHAEDTFKVTGPQIISAAETLTLHPSSKIAKENLEVFCEAWESQLSDMFLLLREISDVFEGRRGEKRAYLSLPRPGKHNTNLKSLKPVRLDSEEQARLGKSGLALCELSSRVNSEMEKWDDPENEIVRRGQCLSSMAYSMYLFTRGEGLLKTTQDLFQQAEAFAAEGLKLVSALLAFSNQLEDDDKPLLLQEIEKMVPAYRQLQVTATAHVQGKSAIFTKVEACIQEARRILNVLGQVLPLGCKLLRKHGTGNGYLRGHRPWRENGFHAATKDRGSPAGNTDSLGIESLKQHVADLTLLENTHF
ncbi:PREDICTED: alpha-catulin [Gekko japonicus]|uniref:Alpha-catulin n=1 Tax=Gekko japonicus TaxID=146911 RepID=A0ABM1JKC6_GEKJA|nr:PREDICTED: alpha-catulin [Gekko japonicus]